MTIFSFPSQEWLAQLTDCTQMLAVRENTLGELAAQLGATLIAFINEESSLSPLMFLNFIYWAWLQEASLLQAKPQLQYSRL